MGQVAELKARLRCAIAASRAERSSQQRAEVAAAIARRVAELSELREPVTVAAYVSFGGEPGTAPLLDSLRHRGHRLLLPVLLPDRDLDWDHEGEGRLGVAAVAAAHVVICPGLAGDLAGTRLGRGGGSYDRALSRCGPDTLRVLLLHDVELVDEVPTEPHDQRVDAVITPTRTLRLR